MKQSGIFKSMIMNEVLCSNRIIGKVRMDLRNILSFIKGRKRCLDESLRKTIQAMLDNKLPLDWQTTCHLESSTFKDFLMILLIKIDNLRKLV